MIKGVRKDFFEIHNCFQMYFLGYVNSQVFTQSSKSENSVQISIQIKALTSDSGFKISGHATKPGRFHFAGSRISVCVNAKRIRH